MSLFRRSSKVLKDFSALEVDLHNHVLPGIDDGSPTLDESRKMLELWQELGIRKVITTPHVINALYPNTKEQILGQTYALQDHIKEWGLDLILEATAEYQIDFEFRHLLENDEVIPFGPQNYLLLEFPFQKPSYSVEEVIYEVQLKGYEPVIAHPERYYYYHQDFGKYEAFRDKGILLQLNLNSLTGLYGGAPKKIAEKLVDAGLIDFAGSDAHFAEHLQDLKKLLHNRRYIKLLESGNLRNATL